MSRATTIPIRNMALVDSGGSRHSVRGNIRLGAVNLICSQYVMFISSLGGQRLQPNWMGSRSRISPLDPTQAVEDIKTFYNNVSECS